MSEQQPKTKGDYEAIIKELHEENSILDQRNGEIYNERNLLAAYLVHVMNMFDNYRFMGAPPKGQKSGWYLDDKGDENYQRVISINGGAITFHVPKEFDLGNMPEIANNWDGHTTEAKWNLIQRYCGMKVEG